MTALNQKFVIQKTNGGYIEDFGYGYSSETRELSEAKAFPTKAAADKAAHEIENGGDLRDWRVLDVHKVSDELSDQYSDRPYFIACGRSLYVTTAVPMVEYATSPYAKNIARFKTEADAKRFIKEFPYKQPVRYLKVIQNGANTKEAEMHKAINAKFKKGDKVVSAGGNRGVVTEVYGNGEYAVHFDGDRNDTRIGEYKLRAANCSTANSVVAKAVANARAATSSAEPTVAKNGAADILVSFTTITAKGLEKVQSRMTESDFDVWAKKVGAGDTQNVYKELATSGKAAFAITRPLSVTIAQL